MAAILTRHAIPPVDPALRRGADRTKAADAPPAARYRVWAVKDWKGRTVAVFHFTDRFEAECEAQRLTTNSPPKHTHYVAPEAVSE